MSPAAIRRWVALLAVLSLGGIVAFVVYGIGFVDYEADVGYRGEARRNPLLAAERTLERLGHRVESSLYLGALPSEDALLVLRQSGRFLSPFDVERLLGWVEQGGHLCVLFPGDAEFENELDNDVEEERFRHPLLDALQLRVRLDPSVEREVQVDFGRGLRRIAFPGRLSLVDEHAMSDVDSGDPMLTRVLSMEHGYGRMTLFVGDDWACNGEFGELDHAYILDDLASFDGERREVRFVLGERPPGLLALVWEHGWAVVTSLAALLALALWRRSFSLGPRLPDLPPGRRDFSEHIRATGEFLWRNRLVATLLAAPRSALRSRMASARPDWLSRDDAKLRADLAAHSGLDPQRVARALDAGNGGLNTAEFTEIVRDLETMRKTL
jgi:hypothetical protein